MRVGRKSTINTANEQICRHLHTISSPINRSLAVGNDNFDNWGNDLRMWKISVDDVDVLQP